MKYQIIRQQIRTGDIIEFKTRSLIGWLIRCFTRKSSNHTALCLGLDRALRYKSHHKFILEANPSGVALNLLSRDLKNFKGEAYLYRLNPKYNFRRPEIARWALSQVGTPYDFKSLFRNVAARSNTDIKKYICSELAFAALVAGGVIKGYKLSGNKILNLDGKPAKTPRPGEFKQFKIFKKPIRIT